MIKSYLCHLYLYIILINFKIGTILRTNCKTFSPKNPSKKNINFHLYQIKVIEYEKKSFYL